MVIKRPDMRAGSLVSRISGIVAVAFQVIAANFVTGSLLACSMKVARASWKASS
jgi:hypothetical protein